MKRIYQVIVNCEDRRRCAEIADKGFSSKALASLLGEKDTIDIVEIDKKIRYSKEDEEEIGMLVKVRIDRDESSQSFIAGFSAMFAYQNKLEIPESEHWAYWTFAGRYLSCAVSHLNDLQSFMYRMKHLGFEGVLEVKVEPYALSFRKTKDIPLSKEEIENRLLDSHAMLLDWTDINDYKG